MGQIGKKRRKSVFEMTNTWVSSEYLKKARIGQFLGLYGLRSVQGSGILLKEGPFFDDFGYRWSALGFYDPKWSKNDVG